jgi:hypothetical protein
MMKEELIKTIDLENNRQLQFYDDSRKVAGDRWMVSLIVRMEIPVAETLIHGDGQFADMENDILRVVGERVVFEQKRRRIFVDESKKEAVLEELCKTFEDSTFRYLAHESFPKKYVLKIYREGKKKESWYKQPSG